MLITTPLYSWKQASIAALNAGPSHTANMNFRSVIAPAGLTGGLGSFLRLTFFGTGSGQVAIAGCAVGHGAAPNFDGGQARVTVGGAASFTPPASAAVLSDIIPFAYDPSKTLLISFYFIVAGSHIAVNPAVAPFSSYSKSIATDESQLTSVTGYTSTNIFRGINLVEVFS